MYHFDLMLIWRSIILCNVYRDKKMIRDVVYVESIMYNKNMLTFFVKDFNEVCVKEVWLPLKRKAIVTVNTSF